MSRARRAVLVSSAVVLAALAASVDAAPRSATRAFGKPVIVHAKSGFEPGVNVTADGRTVYVDVPNGLPSGIGEPTNTDESASYVFKSTNGGGSFKLMPPGVRGNHLGGGDSDITIDAATGVLSMTDLWLGSSMVSVSKDGGATWLSNPVHSTLSQDRQWVAAAKDGRVYHATHQIPAGLVVAMSADSGLTYPTQYVAATVADQTGCVCPAGPLVVNGGDVLTDKIAIAYATSSGQVKVAHSSNSGLTFTNTVVRQAEGETLGAFPVLASPGGSKLVLVWQEKTADSATVLFSASNDWGAKWSTPRVLVRGGTSVFPWVAASGNKVAVSMYRTSEVDAPAKVEGRWYLTYLESRDGGRSWSKPVVADRTPVKNGGICQEGLACGRDRELGDFQSIALDRSGTAHIAYVRSIDGRKTETRYVRQK